MAKDWSVETATGRCAVTGKTLTEGEEFYTVLWEAGDSFVRRDFSMEGWQSPPEDAYCYFKTRVPVKAQRKKLLVNNELLVNFFERLADETVEVRVQFRFVVALILMRKRVLRYDGSCDEDGIEVWDMTLPRDQSRHRVINPRLTDSQIEQVSQELSAILHSDMGEWGSPADVGASRQPAGEGHAPDSSP